MSTQTVRMGRICVCFVCVPRLRDQITHKVQNNNVYAGLGFERIRNVSSPRELYEHFEFRVAALAHLHHRGPSGKELQEREPSGGGARANERRSAANLLENHVHGRVGLQIHIGFTPQGFATRHHPFLSRRGRGRRRGRSGRRKRRRRGRRIGKIQGHSVA